MFSAEPCGTWRLLAIQLPGPFPAVGEPTQRVPDPVALGRVLIKSQLAIALARRNGAIPDNTSQDRSNGAGTFVLGEGHLEK
jgi:hypothetical protein